MIKKTGPAFPEIGNVGYNSDWQNESGMTLRDYFAAKVLPHLISRHGRYPDEVSLWAYRYADAMLKAREN